MKVRFAPSPTGSLHIGNALGAVANRTFGGHDAAADRRHRSGAERPGRRGGDPRRPALARDRLGRRACSAERAAASATARRPPACPSASRVSRSCGRTARATYHLASVVDDIDFGITHVIRGYDHRPNEPLHRALTEALGGEAARVRPLRPRARAGRQEALEARRRRVGRVAARRGHPARGRTPLPRGARFAAPRRPARPRAHPLARRRGARGAVRRGARGPARRSGVGRAGAARRSRPDRGARARRVDPRRPRRSRLPDEHPTLERFRELRSAGSGSLDKDGAKAIVRELKAVGGNLRAVRRRAHRPRQRPGALGGARRAAARRDAAEGRCGSLTRTRSRSSSCRRRPGRCACTSAGRRSTRVRTSATRGRSSSACGCARGCARAATRRRSCTTSPTSTTRSTTPRPARARSSRGRRPSGTWRTPATSASACLTLCRR